MSPRKQRLTSELPEPLQQVGRTRVMWRGRRLSYFGGCDYHRLSTHPSVIRALRLGLRDFGLSVAASRMTTGNHAVYVGLENDLARFFGTESAVFFSSAYLANAAVTQSMRGDYSHAFVDSAAHGSLWDAVQFLDCPVVTFRHCDAADLGAQLKRIGKLARVIVLTDGLFSQNGRTAPLRTYLDLLPRTGTILLDDAHGAGVLGTRGRGAPEETEIPRSRVIQTISLSKAFGGYGGAVLCNGLQAQTIRGHSRIFSGNTPLPLPLATAAVASLRVFRQNPSLGEELKRKARQIKVSLSEAGYALVVDSTPIISLRALDKAGVAVVKRVLLSKNIFPSLIQYPASSKQSYFRFAISSAHSRQQLKELLDALRARDAFERLAPVEVS